MSDFFTGLFHAIGAATRSLGTGLLYALGVAMLVFGVLAFVLEVVLTRTPRLRPRPGLHRNGVTWSPRELLVAAMCGAIYAVTLAVTAGLQLVPGFVQARRRTRSSPSSPCCSACRGARGSPSATSSATSSRAR